MEKSKTPPKKGENRKFKAEVKQVLDIVIHSLYTHREIFIRELVSNASDALEKMRYESLVEKEYTDKDAPFEIRIATDTDNHTISISDTGIGLSHDELVNNLGTIARSGTLEYVKNLTDQTRTGEDMIGKFGVGFYSSFMAATRVRVKTRSYIPGEKSYEWISDGVGSYSITEVDDLPRGTSVIIELKEDAREYEHADRIKSIVKKYSNFVPFPIFVNDELVNTIQAIWLKSTSDLTDSEYTEFFKFISNSEDEPLYRVHLTADAPIQLASILYVPKDNLEQFGFMRLKPSVDLYCKKILLQQNVENLLPDYLRFVRGVIDSADLSLNISRETIQDNLVFRKLAKFLIKRVLRMFLDEAKKDAEKYTTFWHTFGIFLKEGATTDFEHRTEIMKLLRFTSSAVKDDELVSLEDYVGRLGEGKDTIYYLSGKNREEIEKGPYLEAFKKRDIEVLYLLDPVDDFVMTSIGEFEGKKLVSVDSADIDLPPVEGEEEAELPAADVANLIAWIKDTLGDRVSDVRTSKRAIDRPAIIVNPDTGITTGMRRLMKASGRDFGAESPKVLEINAVHPLITTLSRLREGTADKGFLQTCAEQIYFSAMAEANLLDDQRIMVEHVTTIMNRALASEEKAQTKKGKK